MKYVITQTIDIAREIVCFALVLASAATIAATAAVVFGWSHDPRTTNP